MRGCGLIDALQIAELNGERPVGANRAPVGLCATSIVADLKIIELDRSFS